MTLIGLATVVSILGSSFGGLGQLITEGLQTFFPTKYVLGGVLSVLLAFVVDFAASSGSSACATPWARARAEQAAPRMNEIIAWLTDPATWQGADRDPVAARGAPRDRRACRSSRRRSIALPVGLWIGHTGRGANIAINLANIGRAVPSYAVIVIILPISLALQPRPRPERHPDVPRDGAARDPADPRQRLRRRCATWTATWSRPARGMGLRERQILSGVELPLAAPVIVGGFRTAVLNVIATATIGAVAGVRRPRPVHPRRAGEGRSPGRAS